MHDIQEECRIEKQEQSGDSSLQNNVESTFALPNQIDKKNENIEKLGAKIEKQRQQAEKTTDSMKSEDIPTYSQSKEAKQSVEDASAKMNELQQRMDGLRQTVNSTDTTLTENTATSESVAKTEVKIVQEKSVVELKMEQERLQKQYGVLESLASSPNKGKFDENEVKSAMAGLKKAIDDLQAKIDKQQQ